MFEKATVIKGYEGLTKLVWQKAAIWIFINRQDFFFNWDSHYARLNSHYEAWTYKKKKHKKIKAYRKSIYKEPTVNRCLLILDLKPGQKKTFYRQRIPESSCAKKETVDIDILVTSRNGDRRIMQSIRIMSRPPMRKRTWNQWSQFWRTLPK